jgi:tol-pal system protein YbgF
MAGHLLAHNIDDRVKSLFTRPSRSLPDKMSAMKPTIYLGLLSLIALIGCASQGDVIMLDERLAILEIQQSKLAEKYSQVKTDVQKREAKAQDYRTQSAGLRVQIDGLREEIQSLNGKLEEIEYWVRQEKKVAEASSKRLETQLAKLMDASSSNVKRLRTIEDYLDLARSDTGFQAKRQPVSEKQKPQSEDMLYDSAKNFFDEGDFGTAREKFEDFLKKYPTSKRSDNAQFWIGEIYYREKWYEKAIVEYNKVIENYPKGNKVKDALLKQGYAFDKIGQQSNARIVLNELIKKYPNSTQAKIAQKKLAILK